MDVNRQFLAEQDEILLVLEEVLLDVLQGDRAECAADVLDLVSHHEFTEAASQPLDTVLQRASMQ